MPSAASESIKLHEIVRAGAGAGKTYTLTHKVMAIADEMHERENRWPRVVVTTFTRKATQELRERLMLLALDEKPHLIDFVNSRSHLVVSTIHGVMDLFLKRYGGKIGVDPSYSVIGPGEAGKLARQVLRSTLLSNESGRAVLEGFSFNRLAGLFRRLEQVFLEAPNSRAFALEDFESVFATEALSVARELKVVAFKIKEESAKSDWLSMADDYLVLAGLLERSSEPGQWSINYESFLSRLDAMKTARRNAKAPPVTDITADEAEIVRKRLKEFQEPFFDPRVWQIFCAQYEVLQSLAREFTISFRNEKMSRGKLEISDLETLAMDCVRRHPEAAEAFAEDWDYWLIDEYQDTSPFQVELLRALCGSRPNFIVGDPQQSIYLFRGARSEVFGFKEKEIIDSGGRQNLLKMNRRSRPELLLFLNDFFTRFEPPFQPMDPFFKSDEVADSSREVATVFIAPSSKATSAGSSETSLEQTDSVSGVEDSQSVGGDDAELMAMVAHIQKLLDAGAKFEDICVLGRTNRVLTEVAQLLAQFRLPCHVHASNGFFDRREIRDALALLRFLVNPHDNFNSIELMRSPWFRVPDQILADVAQAVRAADFAVNRGRSLWESLVGRLDLEAISRLRELLMMARDTGYSEAFRRGLLESAFIDLSHHHDVSGRRESNVWKLLSRLQQEEAQAGFNPISFISSALHDLKIDESNSEGDAIAAVEPDRINLMTVHASKGLEFKHVLLPRMHQKPRLTAGEEFTFDEDLGLWAMRIPYGEDGDMTKSLPEVMWLRRFQKQELLEHARVLYVALTRAVESVYLSWSADIEANSWADMTRLDLSPGIHREQNYTYTVTSEQGTLLPPAELGEESVEVRPMYSQMSLRASSEGTTNTSTSGSMTASISVTEMLERSLDGRSVGTTASASAAASESATVELATLDLKAVTHRIKVAAEGTAVHRLMELMKSPSRDRLLQLVTKWFPGREERVLAAIQFVGESESPPLAEIIRNGYVEWSFAMVHNGVVIEGQLDLWGRTDHGDVWIVDYKTGSVEYREKAFAQMSIYAIALRKSGMIRANEKIHLAAVYPFSRKIFVELSDLS